MKATRHNGRSGKHGTYDAKHNDRRFDVENSEHIDAERTKFNVYWDCYSELSFSVLTKRFRREPSLKKSVPCYQEAALRQISTEIRFR